MREDGDGRDAERLLAEVRAARAQMPAEHRALLESIGAQEAVIVDWPAAVQDLYVTLGEPPPEDRELAGAAAAWLHSRRTVVFNAAYFDAALAGLDEPSRARYVAYIAWHEFGHALSLTRASAEERAEGPRLLSLLPPPIRDSIGYPGGYRRSEIFDEIVATVYAVMLERIRQGDYGVPEFLHPDVYAAFRTVIPWPPTR